MTLTLSKMTTTFNITKPELFTANVIDVDVDGLRWRGTDTYNNDLGYIGTIAIETEQGQYVSTGEHGTHDYEQTYGFIISSK